MQPEDDSKPVTHAYLREVLIRVDKSLQEYSASISKLQSNDSANDSDLDSSRVEEIERRVNDLHQRIQDAMRDDKSDDRDQSTLQQQIQRLESRFNQLERLEKNEEYEQTTIVNDVRQLQRDFENFEKRFRDVEYKLRKLG